MGYHSLHFGYVFAKYDLFKTWILILNLTFPIFWYNLDTVLYQFVESGTSDRTLIGIDQLLKCLGFIFP